MSKRYAPSITERAKSYNINFIRSSMKVVIGKGPDAVEMLAKDGRHAGQIIRELVRLTEEQMIRDESKP